MNDTGSPSPADSDRGTITRWLDELRSGDPSAVEALWKVYFPQMTAYARRLLGRFRSRFADEEDAALSAFATFWRRFGEGEFSWVTDREVLWKLLATVTARKVRRQRQSELAERRGGGRVIQSSAFAEVLSDEGWPTLKTTEVDAACSELLELLGDVELQTIAVMRLMGYANSEIADDLSLTLRTVERKLRLIRTVWLESLDS